MSFCIPKYISQNLLKAAKAGEFTVQQLTEMTSEQRRELFSRYSDKSTAEKINASLEKALVSEQKTALKNWAQQTFTPKEQSQPRFKNVMKKINDLDELGVLNPTESASFLQDLAAEKLGITVTAEEAQNISERAAKLEALANEPSDNQFGLPNLAYFKARKEMFDYLYSLAPSSNLKILTSTIGRGNLLFSLKSPITNILGNTAQGIEQAFERRLSSGKFGGANGDFAKQYFKQVNKIFKETGYDVTRMLHLDDNQKTLGEKITHSEGKGAVRKIGRFYEDVVFKKLMSAPDVAFSAAHFGDSANIASTKIAEQEGLKGDAAKTRALAIFKDATSLNPTTEEGKAVRAQAIADAEFATYQNDSFYSKLSLGIRESLNKLTGDVRLGDQLMPFVKTPANVIGAGLDASGFSAIRAAFNLKSALESAKNGDKEPLKRVVRDFVRSGLGLTLATIISNLFDPDDFIGEYPITAKEQELLRLRRATPNSVRIGDKWVSLDYFGPIAAPLVGMLYARKYGQGLVGGTYEYLKGAARQSLKLPGVTQVYDLIKQWQDQSREGGKSGVEQAKEAVKGAATDFADFVSARVVPAILYDIGKATDSVERKVDYTDPVQKLQAKIPGLRNQLPARTDVLGREIETESALSTLLFGSRVKTADQTKIVEELVRLNQTGNLPSITDVERYSTKVKNFKTQVSEERYSAAVEKYKDEFAKRLNTLVNSFTYRRADDEKKATLINSAKNDVLDSVLKRSGYRKPKKK